MKQLPMLSIGDKLAEIRRLYFQATPATIQKDLATSARSPEIDAVRRRPGAGDGVHGRARGDAARLGAQHSGFPQAETEPSLI